jgi:selenophosphate synthetase-related protein
MFAECSKVAITIDVDTVPKPDGVSLERWLLTFPSYGYLLSVSPPDVAAVLDLFAARNIAACGIGVVSAGDAVSIRDGDRLEVIRNLATEPLILPTDLGVAA